MPFEIIFYRDDTGNVPVVKWLDTLEPRAQVKFADRINRLKALGYKLRRPAADYLRDGIYELRVRMGRVNYRILYFFHSRTVVVLSHGFKKTQVIPSIEIDKAIQRKKQFNQNPERHSSRGL